MKRNENTSKPLNQKESRYSRNSGVNFSLVDSNSLKSGSNVDDSLK